MTGGSAKGQAGILFAAGFMAPPIFLWRCRGL